MANTPNSERYKLEQFKLETTFNDDGVIHKTYVTDLRSRKRRTSIETTWRDQRVLGSGAFGSVTLQEDKGGNLRAVKQLHQQRGIDYSMELKALTKVSDRNDLFVQFLGWYENKYCVFIAMEFIEYGDLGQYMASNNASESAQEITRQVLEGLVVLHERNICHRDLKPQNILIASPLPIWVKIADFGASKYLKGTQLYTRIGTPGYLAPELLGLFSNKGRLNYSTAVDLWALGSIVFEMLTTEIPFSLSKTVFTEYSDQDEEYNTTPQTDMVMLQQFCSGKITFPAESLKCSKANDHATAFIEALLSPEPSTRLSASAALQTPWIMGQSSERDDEVKSDHRTDVDSEEIDLRPRLDPKQALVTSSGMEMAERDNDGNTALISAAINGHTETVALLLDIGGKIEDKNANGRTALLLAAMQGHTEVVRLLLSRGADLKAIDEYGSTALLLAASQGHLATVTLLIERGADCSSKDNNGYRVLGSAAYNGYTEAVAQLLSLGLDIEEKNYAGQTPLLVAAMQGHTEVVRLLLSRGADLKAIDEYGSTALLLAASQGHLATVTLLIERGADCSSKDNNGYTVLGSVAYRGHTEVVAELLNLGLDIEGKNHVGRTTLLVAAMQGHTEVVRLLLSRGADMNAIDEYDSTALILAANQDHLATVTLLIERGVNCSSKEKNGYTALASAAYRGYTEIVAQLLSPGLEIEEKNNDGRTPLLVAAMQGNTEVVRILLSGGADIDFQDHEHTTALLHAAYQGHKDTLSLLLEQGADITLKDALGKTALMASASRGHTECAAFLQAHMATLRALPSPGAVALPSATPVELSVTHEWVDLQRSKPDHKAGDAPPQPTTHLPE